MITRHFRLVHCDEPASFDGLEAVDEVTVWDRESGASRKDTGGKNRPSESVFFVLKNGQPHVV